MRLPSFRLVALVGGESYRQTASDLHQALDGRVLALPEGLPAWELEAVIQAVVLLGARPLATLRAREGIGRTRVHPEPLLAPPAAVAGLTQIGLLQSGESSTRCALPPELLTLRNAALDIYSQMSKLPYLQALNADALAFTDSPGQLEVFLDAVMDAARDPLASWSDLRAEGLAAVLGRLLSDVTPEVAAWVLLEAAGLPGTEPLAGREALAMGREEGLRRALHAGLVVDLGPPARLRSAFSALTYPPPPGLDRARLVTALRARLNRPWQLALDRLAPAPDLRLGAPPPARHLLGRDEERRRLMAWLQPGRRVPTVVVQGSLGSGKTSLALELGQSLKERLETVWLDFTSGGAVAWSSVARALGMAVDLEEPGLPPPWVARCQEVLRGGPYLIVADNVDGLDEAGLADWLPWGDGRAVVLVLSEGPLRALQRRREALHLLISPLDAAESERLLRLVGPSEMGDDKVHDIVNLLGGHPSSLLLVANALKDLPVDEVLGQIRAGGDWAPPLYAHLVSALEGARWEAVAALGVGPVEGVPEDLARQMADEEMWLELAGEGLVLREGGRLRVSADTWRAARARIQGEPALLGRIRGRMVRVLLTMAVGEYHHEWLSCVEPILSITEDLPADDEDLAAIVSLCMVHRALYFDPWRAGARSEAGSLLVKRVLQVVLSGPEWACGLPLTVSALLGHLAAPSQWRMLGLEPDAIDGHVHALIEILRGTEAKEPRGTAVLLTQALVSVGGAQLALGHANAAAQTLEEAFARVDRAQEDGEGKDWIQVRMELHSTAAKVQRALGDAEGAREHLRLAAALGERAPLMTPNARERAMNAYIELATEELSRGELADAISRLQVALRLGRDEGVREKLGIQILMVAATTRLFQHLRDQGRDAQALEALREHLPNINLSLSQPPMLRIRGAQLLMDRAFLGLEVTASLADAVPDLHEAIRVARTAIRELPDLALPLLRSAYPQLVTALRAQRREAEARSIEAEAALLPPEPAAPPAVDSTQG